MGLFQHKHDDAVLDEVAGVFDEQYRDELRQQGRDYMEKVVDEHVATLTKDLQAAAADITTELKTHMTKQLDATISHMNTELSKHLQERLKENDRVTQDAQDLVVQSLNRSAQALHAKYQELGLTLQQTVASQEAMMIGVLEENKVQMSTTQTAQAAVLKTLQETAKVSQDQSCQLYKTLEKTATEQATELQRVYKDNTTSLVAVKTAQDAALATLTSSVQALQQQHDELRQMLETNVARQEAMLVDAFQANMAQIVEQYLLGALGEQYDVKAQLPAIIKQLEANKDAIKEDMTL